MVSSDNCLGAVRGGVGDFLQRQFEWAVFVEVRRAGDLNLTVDPSFGGVRRLGKADPVGLARNDAETEGVRVANLVQDAGNRPTHNGYYLVHQTTPRSVNQLTK